MKPGCFVLLLLSACATTADSVVTVVRVLDGDTIVVASNGRNERVRLVGVDAPEMKNKIRSGEAFANESRAYLEQLLEGRQVRLVPDRIQGERGDFGRLIAYVYRLPDGLFVNGELVRQGYARAEAGFETVELQRLQALEKEARSTGRGLWSAAGAGEAGNSQRD